MRSAASATPPLAPNSLPADVRSPNGVSGASGGERREVEAVHPNQLRQLARGEHGVDVRPAVARHLGPPGLELLGRARHDRHAVDARRVDRLALGEEALDDGPQHLLRALAGGEVRDHVGVELLDELDPARRAARHHRQAGRIAGRQPLHQFRRLLHDREVGGERRVEHAAEAEAAEGGRQRAVHVGARLRAELLGQAHRHRRRVLDDDVACRGRRGRRAPPRAALCSVSAPVGQTATHCPQLTQLLTFSPSSNAGPTCARLPRPMKSMAPTVWISSHTRTHLPHRMHLAGSRTIDGLATSICARRPAAEVAAPTHAELLRQRLQLAVAAARAVEAVVRVVGEQQLDERLARVDRARRVRPHLHARRHREGAARHEARAGPRRPRRTCGRRRSAAAPRSGTASGWRLPRAAPPRGSSRRPARPPFGR